MTAIVSPEEMGAIDRASPEPVEVLIGRAGAAVERCAVEMLGGTYGRRVVVIAGKGNNGADGREAERRLARRGVRTTVLEASQAPPTLPETDLVIDAAYGTGFRGQWVAPQTSGSPLVLAVDIPSGVEGLTGSVDRHSRPLPADATVTFAALKPGLLFGEGKDLAGEVRLADIGLDTSSATCHLVGAEQLAGWYPARPPGEHKWRSAVWAIGGSPGMEGALGLVCAGAQRTGAGYVRCSSPGAVPDDVAIEAVRTGLPATEWAATVLSELDRFGALVVGNGLGRHPAHAGEVCEVLERAPVPTVVDADGLTLLGRLEQELRLDDGDRVVLTPHDGEYRGLVGEPPVTDRVEAARLLAVRSGAVALLKGPTTVVAHPDRTALVVADGDARLATAGTGDVLAGVIAALCARGLAPFRAAALGAYLHGAAARLGLRHGFVAGDLPRLVSRVLDEEIPGAL